MKLYLDTSVIGGYFDPEFSENTVLLFDEIFKGFHDIIISKVTIKELSTAPKNVRELINKIPMVNLEIVELTQAAETIANIYLNEKIISQKYFTDAFYILL